MGKGVALYTILWNKCLDEKPGTSLFYSYADYPFVCFICNLGEEQFLKQLDHIVWVQ